jgi:hypothetical protein
MRCSTEKVIELMKKEKEKKLDEITSISTSLICFCDRNSSLARSEMCEDV